MDEDKEQSLEAKINFLIAESEKSRLERKREKILSKIDALYTVLIALSTFATGIAIAQYSSSYESGVWVFLVQIVVAMLFSYWVGFKGMIGDSIENRLFAWCLLIAFSTMTVIGLSVTCLVLLVKWLNPSLTGTMFILTIPIEILLPFPTSELIAKKFTLWAQSRLGSLLGEDLVVWEKIKMKLTVRLVAILIVAGVLIAAAIAVKIIVNPANLFVTT